MKKVIKYILYKLIYKHFENVYKTAHRKEMKMFCADANVKLKKLPNEREHIDKWKKIYHSVDLKFFRFYANYIGQDINIVPDDIFHIIIEPILNNQRSLSTYSDKNMYEKLLSPQIFPTCIIRNIDGDYLDKEYEIIDLNEDLFNNLVLKNEELIKDGKIIIKPTIDTCAGNGVRLFKIQENGDWLSNDDHILTLSYLKLTYRKNFILQRTIEPSDFIRQFNQTSYSTLRIITYRSVKTDIPHILGMYLRVGATGSFKDNVWGGGYACCIQENGVLSNFASDSKRKKYNEINGISLTDSEFRIPNFSKVEELVKSTAKQIIPNRLLSFDIMLDKDNNPHVIEFNLKHQTVTTLQTLQKAYFGEYTNEVIDYCQKNLNKITYQINIEK